MEEFTKRIKEDHERKKMSKQSSKRHSSGRRSRRKSEERRRSSLKEKTDSEKFQVNIREDVTTLYLKTRLLPKLLFFHC